MKKLLFSLALIALTGVATAHGPASHHHDFSDITRWVNVFEEPGREQWQKPKEVIEWLGQGKSWEGKTVADIGAASGYFTRAWARSVGPRGWAIAVEIEPGFFAPIHKLARQEGLNNVLTAQCGPHSPGLPEASVDVVFICDTLHHIQQRSDYYREVKRALKPGGCLAVVEFIKDKQLPFGPKNSERISTSELVSELQEAGFTTRTNETLLPYQYVVDARL